ncbi:MAG: universal stress protein [Flavobacteriales bacterium]
MNRIIFPTDFSHETENALKYAKFIAKETDSELILVNAFDLDLLLSSFPEEANWSFKVKNQESKKKLKELKEEIQSDDNYKDLNINVFAAFGDAITGIEDVAKEFETDLIVMGTKGLSEIKDFFTDSNAFNVIERVECPVLIIPEDFDYTLTESIMFATDYTHTPSNHLSILKDIAKGIGAEIKIVHVSAHPERVPESDAVEGLRQEHFFGEQVEHKFDAVRLNKLGERNWIRR